MQVYFRRRLATKYKFIKIKKLFLLTQFYCLHLLENKIKINIIDIIGIKNQNKIRKKPNININNCVIMPIIIKKNLHIAPIILENILEIRVLKNSPILNPLGYLHLYLLQGEKNVFNKRGIEKKLAPNEI